MIVNHASKIEEAIPEQSTLSRGRFPLGLQIAITVSDSGTLPQNTSDPLLLEIGAVSQGRLYWFDLVGSMQDRS